jgi:hypothetical protein
VSHSRGRQLVLAAAIATIGPLGGRDVALASTTPPKLNSFALSGQISATLPLDRRAQCIAGNSTHTGAAYTFRVFLDGQQAKPAGVVWALVIETAHTGTTKIPGRYPVFASLIIVRGASNQYDWTSTANSGSGTVTITGDAKQGSVNLMLPPAKGYGGAAKRVERVVGSWKC